MAGRERFDTAKAFFRWHADHGYSFTDCTSFVVMNGAIAGAAGALKDVADELGGPPVQSPIFAHPQFERIEANGVGRHGSKIAAAVRAIVGR